MAASSLLLAFAIRGRAWRRAGARKGLVSANCEKKQPVPSVEWSLSATKLELTGVWRTQVENTVANALSLHSRSPVPPIQAVRRQSRAYLSN